MTQSRRILMVAPTSFFSGYGCHIRIAQEAHELQRRGHVVRIATYHNGDDVAELEEQRRRAATLAQTQIHESADALAPPPVADADPGSEPYVRAGRKVGRNDPCPCGSGRKFKQCHGKLN